MFSSFYLGRMNQMRSDCNLFLIIIWTCCSDHSFRTICVLLLKSEGYSECSGAHRMQKREIHKDELLKCSCARNLQNFVQKHYSVKFGSDNDQEKRDTNKCSSHNKNFCSTVLKSSKRHRRFGQPTGSLR